MIIAEVVSCYAATKAFDLLLCMNDVRSVGTTLLQVKMMQNNYKQTETDENLFMPSGGQFLY